MGMDTPTLQDRLRAAADVYSEHPPIFGLLFEAADALTESTKQLDAARADMLREGIRAGELEAELAKVKALLAERMTAEEAARAMGGTAADLAATHREPKLERTPTKCVVCGNLPDRHKLDCQARRSAGPAPDYREPRLVAIYDPSVRLWLPVTTTLPFPAPREKVGAGDTLAVSVGHYQEVMDTIQETGQRG